MELLIPDFLKHVKLTKTDLQEAAPHMSNWLRILDAYKTFDKTAIEKYLIIEINYKQRKSVLDRLMGRYAKLLKAEQIEQIETVMGSTFRTGYVKPVNGYVSSVLENEEYATRTA